MDQKYCKLKMKGKTMFVLQYKDKVLKLTTTLVHCVFLRGDKSLVRIGMTGV